MKEMMKNTGIMVAITLIAGLLLGIVYQVTKEPIAVQEAKAKEAACQEVFQDASSFAMIGVEALPAGWNEEGYAQESVDEVMEAKDASGELIGYVITVTTKEGYGGDIQFSIGVRMDGTVNGISILSISETAGLGMQAEEVLKPQFADKNVIFLHPGSCHPFYKILLTENIQHQKRGKGYHRRRQRRAVFDYLISHQNCQACRQCPFVLRTGEHQWIQQVIPVIHKMENTQTDQCRFT